MIAACPRQATAPYGYCGVRHCAPFLFIPLQCIQSHLVALRAGNAERQVPSASPQAQNLAAVLSTDSCSAPIDPSAEQMQNSRMRRETLNQNHDRKIHFAQNCKRRRSHALTFCARVFLSCHKNMVSRAQAGSLLWPN